MALSLDDIDYFLAVARHRQVRRAALDLGLSQPAVTKGIRRLEQELGFPLFVRSRRGMEITAVAERFHERVRTLRDSLGEAIKEAADLHLGELGVLRVGASPLYAQRLFVPACLRLHRERPAARVNVHVNLNDALLLALRRGDIDLSVNALPAELPPDLAAAPLMSDDLCVVVREGDPLLARRRLRLADLAQARWMLPGPAVAARRAIEGRLADAGLPPARVVVEVNNTAGQLMELLRQSDLVSLMSESMLATPAGAGVVPLAMAEARIRRRIGVLTRAGGRLPPLAERMVEILCERAGPPAATAGAAGRADRR
jgi:DNA-binding transcriptional LysR family regulator